MADQQANALKQLEGLPNLFCRFMVKVVCRFVYAQKTGVPVQHYRYLGALTLSVTQGFPPASPIRPQTHDLIQLLCFKPPIIQKILKAVRR